MTADEAEFEARETTRAREIIGPHFDAVYYLASHPVMLNSGIDPLDHFLTQGWREGRDPSPLFNVRYYLATNGDIAGKSTNPFLHYLDAGRDEGRLARRPLDLVRRHLEASSAPSTRVAEWSAVADGSAPISLMELRAALSSVVARTGLVVSVSHDDYAVNFGGLQSMIGDEQQAFLRAGWGYLHLSPAAPLPLLATSGAVTGFRVRMRLDGGRVGVALLADVIRSIAELRGRGQTIEVVFHHLMGWAPEALEPLPKAAGVQAVFWIHDFFTLCPSYALMRNDLVHCGAPPAHSPACQVCSFGSDRDAHVSRMTRFFDVTAPFMLAPSASALSLWVGRGALRHVGTTIVPLARLLLSGDTGEEVPDGGPSVAGRPLRVAHAGARLMHKGWTVFEELALQLQDDARYEFMHFGVEIGAALPGCIRSVPVRVTADTRDGMIEALAEHGVDVVISGSLWPETFCFAAHEAIAAGAYVLARAGAGHVWPMIANDAPGQGWRFETEAELAALFISGAVVDLVAGCAVRRGTLLPGRGTADWVLHARPMVALAAVDADA